MKQKTARIMKTVLIGVLPLAGFLAVLIIPLLMTILHAFSSDNYLSSFAGLDHFCHLAQSRLFRLGLRNTLIIGSGMVAGSLCLSLLIAWWMLQCPGLVKPGIGILILPLLLPSVSAAAIWKEVFQTGAFMDIGKARLALGTLFGWKYTGICAVLILIELRNIPQSILDSAMLDGADRYQCFRSIQLPLISGSLGISLILLLVFFFRVYKEAYLLFGEYPNEGVYLLQHYMSQQYMKLNYPYVSAAATVLMLLCAMLYGVGLLGIKRRNERV